MSSTSGQICCWGAGAAFTMGTCFGTSVRFLCGVYGADGLSLIVHPMYGYSWHCSMTGHVRHAHTW